jgi:hypothetical protein
MVAMLIRRGNRRIVYAGPMQLAIGALNRAVALQVKNAALERELAELHRRIAAERAAHDQFVNAVAARRHAESELIEFYREACHARVTPDATPPRWLH